MVFASGVLTPAHLCVCVCVCVFFFLFGGSLRAGRVSAVPTPTGAGLRRPSKHSRSHDEQQHQ